MVDRLCMTFKKVASFVFLLLLPPVHISEIEMTEIEFNQKKVNDKFVKINNPIAN